MGRKKMTSKPFSEKPTSDYSAVKSLLEIMDEKGVFGNTRGFRKANGRKHTRGNSVIDQPIQKLASSLLPTC